MNSIGQTTVRPGRWGMAVAAVLALGVGACDSLLEVDLPATVTDQAVDNPSVAPVLLSSIMGHFECGYSAFLMDAAGHEDNFHKVTGVAGNYSEFTPNPDTGDCDTGGSAYDQSYLNSMLVARGQAKTTYNAMLGWGTSQDLVATVAFYEAAILDLFGEYYCEFAIDNGPIMSPVNTLDSAEVWIATSMAAVTAFGGDFAITTAAGTHTSSISTSLSGLRARIRWARRQAGDLAAAAADAALVPDGHITWVLREDGSVRRNMVATSQSGAGGIQAAGYLLENVRLKDPTNDYGLIALGSHPNGTAWTSPLRFTGYIDLGIETATGRAVAADGFPVLETDAGAEDDTRVTHTIGNTAGGPDNIPQRYTQFSDDIPLINWKEMRLIEAEAAGNTLAGIAFVNRVRAGDGLPPIGGGGDDTYRDALLADADLYEDMIIEERRRALFEEGRFWSTKIIHNDKLWFPRAFSGFLNSSGDNYFFGGGVRQLIPNAEYEVNPNFVAAGGLAARGTACDPFEAPIV